MNALHCIITIHPLACVEGFWADVAQVQGGDHGPIVHSTRLYSSPEDAAAVARQWIEANQAE